MTTPRSYPRPALVPELNVTSLPASLAFWRELLGFRILYDRPEQASRPSSAKASNSCWRNTTPALPKGLASGRRAREKPNGRGINFEITVSDVATLLAALGQASWPIFFGPEERWYRVGSGKETGVRQLLVQDPDGYLLCFSQPLGRRPLAG